jgi:hypothetical protein
MSEAVTAMAGMSKAIRLEIQKHSPDNTLPGLPDEILADYVQIVGAFYMDLKDALDKRRLEAQ